MFMDEIEFLRRLGQCDDKEQMVRCIDDYNKTHKRITTHKTITNGDRIRAMSDEGLAGHLHEIGWDCHLCSEHMRLDNEPLLRGERCDEKCVKHCLEWLQQPAEVEDNAE